MARANPWHRIRHAYITGSMGQKALAEQFGVSARELSRRSAEEGWVDARAEFRARAAAKAIDRAVDEEADKLEAVRSVADTLAGQLAAIMTDADQLHMYTAVCRDAGGVDRIVEKRLDSVNTKALRDVVGALRELTTVLRNLHGIQTAGEAEAARIAAEKLKLEQRKANLDETDKKIVVAFADPAEEELSE